MLELVKKRDPLNPDPLCQRIVWLYSRYEAANGKLPERILLSHRIARGLIAELRDKMPNDPGGEIPPEQLTVLFGVPVELAHDLPQGISLRP